MFATQTANHYNLKAWLLVTFSLLATTAHAATKVAVIDRNGGGGSGWCSFLVNNGYECTLFPATGPTQSLGPFQIIVNLSNVWSDPDDLLADQMMAGKGIITWGDAPFALELHLKPLVREWIGADQPSNGGLRLLTVAMDSILDERPVGSELANCNDSFCLSVSGTNGHTNAKVLARFEQFDSVALLRNTWGEGRSLYCTDYLSPFSHPEIFTSVFSEFSRSIPASSTWGLVIGSIALLLCGSLTMRRLRPIS